MVDKIKPPVISKPTGPGRFAMPGETIVGVSSDGGGCLVSLRVIDGRLRIEVYRADDTVDVVAPGLVMPRHDMSSLAFPRGLSDRRAMDGE